MPGSHRTALGSALSRKAKVQVGSKQDHSLKVPDRPGQATVTVPLPPDDPAMIRLAELQERRHWIALEIARPIHDHFSSRLDDLKAQLREIDRAISAIETTVELPLDWWALPIGHPHRGLARQLAEGAEESGAAEGAEESGAAEGAEESGAAEETAECSQVDESLEVLAAASDRLLTGMDALRVTFGQCADREESTELYREWQRANRSKTLPRSITGPRNARGGGPENWPRCGAPTKAGTPCRRMVYCRGGKPYTHDGHCWRHSSDPRVRATYERWLTTQRTGSQSVEARAERKRRYWAEAKRLAEEESLD